MIAFTKEFFHHVYVMPEKLKKYAPPDATSVVPEDEPAGDTDEPQSPATP